MTSRNYCLLTLSMTLFGLGGVACINWFVDPYGQYGTGIVPVIVQASRTQKLDLMEKLDEVPLGLILGSSRVQKIEPRYLEEKTGLSFFNAGVNHGRPTDYLAIVRWYQKRWKSFPEIVVIGVDAEALNAVVPLDGRISTEQRLAANVPEAITWKDGFSRYTELVGFKQLRSSISGMQNALRPRVDDDPVETIQPDGLLVYRHRESELRNGTYDFKSALRYNELEYTQLYRTYHEISGTEAMRLVETVRLLQKHGTRVYLFVTPFHPELIESLSHDRNFDKRENETRQLLSLLARHDGAIVADLGDLSKFDGDPTQFVDGIHPLEPNTRLMMDRLLEVKGASQYALQ